MDRVGDISSLTTPPTTKQYCDEKIAIFFECMKEQQFLVWNSIILLYDYIYIYIFRTIFFYFFLLNFFKNCPESIYQENDECNAIKAWLLKPCPWTTAGPGRQNWHV